MRKIMFFAVVSCLFVTAAQAQKGDFSGTWKLDTANSKLSGMPIESMTMTVEQSSGELAVTTVTKRAAPPADAPAGGGGRPGGGGGRGMGSGMGDGKTVYSLEGKETTIEVDGPNGKMPVKLKAARDAGSLKLSSSRSLAGPMGEITITTVEKWTLSADGTKLTVEREQSTPRGAMTSTLVFNKG
ncbi:MAG TPA: hypothetical protein PKD26_07150 [Pyrinomonadaceae bacterium]|nr:hypothetical protein [Pyrinomonadaceae bacterium]